MHHVCTGHKVISDQKENATEWFEQMQRLMTRNMLSTH